MSRLTISELAQQVNLRPSAIRYYEQIGIIDPADRVGGQRRYDKNAIYRLAVVQHARRIGFTLDEIRQLFAGFPSGTRASQRWQTLSRKKLLELEEMMERIKTMQQLLMRLQKTCTCSSFDQCGQGIFEAGLKDSSLPLRAISNRRQRPS